MPKRMEWKPKGKSESNVRKLIRGILDAHVGDMREGPARDAAEDGVSTVEEYMDEIVEKIMEDGEASDDLMNDYGHGDSYHHESHVDRSYNLLEAAQILDALSSYEETDSGLWEGQEPRDAISTLAAYTYGNAVYAEWQELVRKINESVAELIETEES